MAVATESGGTKLTESPAIRFPVAADDDARGEIDPSLGSTPAHLTQSHLPWSLVEFSPPQRPVEVRDFGTRLRHRSIRILNCGDKSVQCEFRISNIEFNGRWIGVG
ncbi:uncharacterized protein LOC127261956 [Andrographis paniculata]|uniref:uncharacterized protein LOC127261956 n=1 Tax=Andrographis paniculata TaxID=175694 RepID=UPI0021E81D8A|nr:uncharacterized protein LOC127261956 [Andrographis paniculata]